MLKSLIKKAVGLTGYELHRRQHALDDRDLYIAEFGKDAVDERRFYNISAGGHFGFGCGIHHPCWTNVDVDRPWDTGEVFDPARDIAHDPLDLRPLPVETASAELAHSRLSIEHITDQAASNVFHEVWRILKPGGIFRVATPNIDLDYRAFLRGNLEHFRWYYVDDLSIEQKFLSHFAVQPSVAYRGQSEKISDAEFQTIFRTMPYAEALDYCTSKCDLAAHKKDRGHHINWWNPAKLQRMLTEAGFQTVYLSAPEQSASPVLCNERFFDNWYNKFIMYVEAIK